MFRISWTRRIATFVTVATMAGFGLTGIASAQTITNTGPGSRNNITTNVTNNCSVRNTNTVSATNYNHQTATTGSANESGNTTAGSWGGWSTLDPSAAQAAGDSYSSWWNGVVNWMADHASGNGWNSDESNLTWAPSGTDWSGFDPLAWQANGQSFGNWYNSVEAYLNGNNGVWALSWPADATGTFGGGATSGSAINSNSANFSITINNAASAAAGTNSCGQSNFVPPTCTSCGGSGGGGMGGGPVSTPVVTASSVVPKAGSGGVGGLGGVGGGISYGSGSGGYSSPVSHPASSPVVASAPSSPSTPSGGSGGGGMGGGGGTPSAPVSTISNTGPGSSNNVTSNYTDNSSVSNSNCVTVVNTSSQSASSGNANVSGNTSAGGGGSGNASNGNGTGVGGTITN